MRAAKWVWSGAVSGQDKVTAEGRRSNRANKAATLRAGGRRRGRGQRQRRGATRWGRGGEVGGQSGKGAGGKGWIMQVR